MSKQIEQEMQQELLANEKDILAFLTDTRAQERETERIDLNLNGVRISFRIRPLSDAEVDICKRKSTKYSKVKKLGNMRLPEDTDVVKYHSTVIYMATVEEDRKALWDNRKYWDACNVITGVDMVDKLIPYAGIKHNVVERIEELSGIGYEADEAFEDTVKN